MYLFTSIDGHRIYSCVCHLQVNIPYGFVCYSRLLDILAGRKDRKHLSGHVLVNGLKQPENFKCITGYVVQVCLLEQVTIFVQYYDRQLLLMPLKPLPFLFTAG